MKLPRFLSKCVPGFEVKDVKEWINKGEIHIHLERIDGGERTCARCGHKLKASYGKHPMRVQHMPLFKFRVYFMFFRTKAWCENCGKVRSEHLDFIAKETPHLSQEYAWWLGHLCEISAVSRAAEFTGHNSKSMWTLDFNRMRRMLQHYKIPPAERISVDEVYARKKSRHRGESRNKKFFTVISDLDSRRVLWVSESRDKEALDEFFKMIGKEQCDKIKVVAMDQHDPYKASVKEYCASAQVVWDKFHLVKTFEEALNEERKTLHENLPRNLEEKRLTRGKYRYLFLKKARRRTSEEKRHIEDVMENNRDFYKLELIKEKMLTIFDNETAEGAWEDFEEIGSWIMMSGFEQLKRWHDNFEMGWNTFKNWFKHRVTSSLSEGQNNVIKTLKRRAFGYRNMTYFKLKILQVCGYLNSRYIADPSYLDSMS